MPRFRKKPVVIEAVRVGDALDGDCPKWLHESETMFHTEDRTMTVHTLEGPLTGREEDWIIQGVNGELYPCKPDIFEKTYDAVLDDPERPAGATELVKTFDAMGVGPRERVFSALSILDSIDALDAESARKLKEAQHVLHELWRLVS